MILVEKMKNMKIYETKTFLPTLEKDKKKKSNIVLLSPNYNASNALMNHPLFENKRRYESYYMERDVSYYIGQKVAETIDESVIEETKRSNLPDSDFGIPDERKFPLDTEQHVRSAIKLFGHAPEDKKKSLARKISSRAKSYGIEIPNTTQVYKYLHEEDEHKHADHSELETIIFDIGGVLVENLDVDEMMLDAGIPGYFIQDFKDNFWNKLNSDTADMEDARIAFNALCKDDLEMKSYADMAFDVLCTSIKPCDYNDKILSMLKSKGYKLYYLSNWSKYSFDLCNIMQKMPFLKYFDDGIVSYQIGFKKPDVSIYELFKNKFDIGNPNTCLFIDDKQENVNAALSCGLNAVKWDQVEGPSYILNNFVVEAFNERTTSLSRNISKLNSIIESVEDGHKYYLISDKFLGDNKKIKPAVPKGSLDQKTERIRFYKSINGAMMAKGDNEVNTGREMFVHVPVDEDNIKVITPSTSVVPNAMLTGEVWCKELTTVKCIGKIRVGKPIKKYEYKEGKETKECHSWQYSWLNSQDKHVVESVVNEASTELYKKIISNPTLVKTLGFVSGRNNIYNENVIIKEYNKPLRGRSELLILKGDSVLLRKEKNGYSLPGGGWEKDEDHNISAEREANEECRVKVKDVSYSNTYAALFPPKDWVKEKIDKSNWWYGEYCEVYVGTYDGKFTGKVDLIDQDKYMEENVKFYPIESVKNLLIDQHKKAIKEYMENVAESVVNESKDKSIYEKNFKKKSGKTFKYLDMKSPEAKKYITKEWINDKNAEIAVCKEDDELAGFIYVNKSGNIAPLKVYEKYRGYGIGDRLFKDAVEKFKGKKLGVYKDNEVAINLYKKYGFEQVGVKKYKDGDEVLIMEKKKNVKESSDDLILI